MLNVYAIEGEVSYEIDDLEVQFHGQPVFVHGKSTVVYGMENGELVWDFDDIGIVYVTDVDGNDLNLTAAEEAEIADIIRKEHSKNDYIDSLVWAGHDEYAYYNYRRR